MAFVAPAMLPPRLSVMTLNLWRDHRWAHREPALERCLETIRPDVLCLQELLPRTRQWLDDVLAGYDRVEDDFPGWETESNIYWRADTLECVGYGTAEVGVSRFDEHRRLFWVRLAAGDRTVLASTAHYTAQNHEHELETGQSPRIEQSRRTAEALTDLAGAEEAVVFTGDLNDTFHPRLVLEEAGFSHPFGDLNIPVPPTFPARPTRRDRLEQWALDWIFGKRVRSVAATVPRFYHEDAAPSDHWPVLAVYELP